MLRKIFLGIVFVMITSLLIPPILRGASAQTATSIEWAARYNGPNVPGSDVANKVAMDSSGNVYVTGLSPSVGQGNDYVTVKYNSAGAQVWVTRYNRGTGNDAALDIAVDSAGNVYVTGNSGGDYATIKYDSNGIEIWVKIHDSGGIDSASAIAVDSAGNVYVTGGSSNDYVTIKYDSAGTEQWIITHDSGQVDYANNIAVDSAGSVYVTGRSNDDFVTVKYDSAGTEQWIASYNGPGNGIDAPLGLAVKNGYVYVTGQSLGSGTNDDYATIKYDSVGTEQWVARYDGPASGNDRPSLNFHNDNPADGIAVDSDGDVYVTGYSERAGGIQDFATVKYRGSDGTQEWASRYSIGSGNLSNGALVLYESLSGDVSIYVIGSCKREQTDYDYATVKYDGSDGSQVAEAFYDLPALDYPFAIAIDQVSGTISVTGRSQGSVTNNDYATVKYDSDLNELWPARYDGPGNISNDYAYAVATDSSGNVYVAGYSGGGAFTDYATIKYDSAGTEQWVARYNGPGNDADYAMDIAVDPIGNIYVTGYSHGGPATRQDFATIKYDTNGTEQWVRRHHGGYGNANDYVSAIAADSAGNVYVTGYSYSERGWNYITIKYDTAGTEQWVASYDGPAGSNDYPLDIIVDFSGNVYVTGYSAGIGTNYDTATVKYDSAGTEQWVASYGGAGPDRGNSIAVDSSGNAYVTGRTYESGSDNYATIKYDSAGVQQWVDHYNGPGDSTDVAFEIALDSAGNAYVTGHSIGSGTNYDMATIKYDTNGNREWVHRYNGPGNSIDRGFAIAVDTCGNAYVAGPSWEGNGVDYATLMYPADYVEGQEPEYFGRYHYEAHDVGYDIALDSSGNACVTGYSWGEGWDIATIKYSPDPITQIANLICKVENLVNIGVLNQQQGKGLIAKLNEALKNLNKAKPNYRVACNKLSDFIDQVNAYINSGVLTPIQGQALIDAANVIINELGG